MRQKIYDILPPNQVEEPEAIEKEPEEVEIEVREEPVFEKQKFKQPRKPLGKKLYILIIFILLIGIVVGVYSMTDTKAAITLYPKVEQLNAEREVVVATDENFELDEASRFLLSGRVLSDEETYNSQINATGSADGEGYAKGTIKVYIEHTPSSSLPLIKGTRFLSEKNQKIYRVQKAINIPAGADGQPGTLEIEVVADEPGNAYNLDSSKFTVPGLEGSAYYATTWAETVTSISGGAEGVGKAVSESDIVGAKEKFKQQQFESIKSKLMSSVPGDYMLLDTTISQEISSFEVKAKAGDRVDSFDVSGKIKTVMIAVKKDDMNNLLKNIANISGEGNFAYNIKNLRISDPKGSNDHYEMKMAIEAEYYSIASNDEIIKSVNQKSKEEAASLLTKDGKIEKAEIKIDPMWKNIISSKKENIDIKIEALAK